MAESKSKSGANAKGPAKAKAAAKAKPAPKPKAAKGKPASAKLAVGDLAPAFRLSDESGKPVSSKDFRGKQRIVLYFYPRDNTPGCTKEACSFRDHLAAIQAKDAVVFGVSPDSAAAHRRFIEKFDLNFPLLVDTDHKVAEAYGAWGEKVLYGRRFLGMIRKTFVIGKDGRIEYANNKVKADGHGEQIANLL